MREENKKKSLEDKKGKVNSYTSRNFIGTKSLKNIKLEISCEEYLKYIYEKLDAVYVCGQLEKKEDTPHIQYFIHTKQAIRVSQILKLDEKTHIEKAIMKDNARAYCMKEETRIEGPWEFGQIPIKRNSHTDWKEVWELSKKGQIEKIPESIRVIHYNKIKQIEKDYLIHEDCQHLRGFWIYGPAGSGKSRWVREHVKRIDLYPKLANRWWDGYKNQKVVVLDDFMPENKNLTQSLKIWSDRYGCILEIKGGAVSAKYEWFIITSQYQIKEIFTDQRDYDAISRRFQEWYIFDLIKYNFELNY